MTGRPSKLSDRQWGEIGRRLANGGESASALAREFRVSKSIISERFSNKVDQIKTIAEQIVSADRALAALPVSGQCSVMSLVDQMKGIQNDYAITAANGARTAAHLSGLARRKSERFTEDVETEDLRTVTALSDTANKALTPASNLIAANKPKDGAVQDDTGLATLTIAPVRSIGMDRK